MLGNNPPDTKRDRHSRRPKAMAVTVLSLLLLGSLALTGSTGQSSGHATRLEAPRAVAAGDVAPSSTLAPPAAPVPSTAPTGDVGTAMVSGYISWAEPDLGVNYLATRFVVGTLVRLCSFDTCIVRRSTDFGPSAAIDPPRIADLAVLDWEQLCGLPRARGLCKGTVEAIEGISLPQTDVLP